MAPSVVLDVQPVGMRHVLDQLDDGSVELALTTLTEGGDRFKCVGLLEDDYVVLFANDHPAAAKPDMSIERFADLPHISITSSGDDAQFIDDVARRTWPGAFRSIRLIPLHSVVSVLIGSNAIAVVPRLVAVDLIAVCALTMRALPFGSPRVALSMIWHRRLDNHAAHRWLRGTLRAMVAGPSRSRRVERHIPARFRSAVRSSMLRSAHGNRTASMWDRHRPHEHAELVSGEQTPFIEGGGDDAASHRKETYHE